MNKINLQKSKQQAIAFWKNEEGLGTLEILLIVAVLVAIAIIFRKWIVGWFQKLINNADTNLNQSEVNPYDPSAKKP